MKIVFITDFAAVSEKQSEQKSCITLYSMAKKCILQILHYLKQSSSSSFNQIDVGFKYCDTRAHQYQIPQQIANSNKKFYRFTLENVNQIQQQFSADYKATFKSRKQPSKRINISTPILSTSRSSRRSMIRSQPSTPTSTMTLQLRDQSGLSQIIIALSQCMKQYKWTQTSLNIDIDNDHIDIDNDDDDGDYIEPQMIFILSSIPNDDSIESISEWKDVLKVVTNKSISINWIHIGTKPFISGLLPNGNDKTEIKYINGMDLCLRQFSHSSIGIIPLTLLWMAPILKLHHQFIQIFKTNNFMKRNKMKNNLSSNTNIHCTFWSKLSHNKLYQEVVRWKGNVCIANNQNRRSNRLNKNKNKNNNNNNNNNKLKVLFECELVSIECNRWKKYVENIPNKTNLSQYIYDILLNKNNENVIDSMYIDGVLDENSLNEMDHLPYISLIIRANIDDALHCNTNSNTNNKNTKSKLNTNQETNENISSQQFEELFLSTTLTKKYFVVKFNHCDANIKGIMYSVIPSFIILRIYTFINWNNQSIAIHHKLKELTINHDDDNDDEIDNNINNCVESMLSLNELPPNPLDLNNNNNNNNNNDQKLNKKKKMKRSLQMLYAAKLNHKKQEIQRQQALMDESLKESNTSNTRNTSNTDDIDMSHLELLLASHQNKTAQQQYEEICKSFMNIYSMLLSKKLVSSQYLYSFINGTYGSLFKLCTSQLFVFQRGRAKIKTFLAENIFVDVLKFKETRKNLNNQQQIFDIKVQILLNLEYGCIHFRDKIIVDPIQRYKHFEGYLGKLQIKSDTESFNEFISYIIEKYAHKLPKSFAMYYTNKEQDIPIQIACHLKQHKKKQINHNKKQINNNNNNNNIVGINNQYQNDSSSQCTSISTTSISTATATTLTTTVTTGSSQTTESNASNTSRQKIRSKRNRKRRYSEMQNEDKDGFIAPKRSSFRQKKPSLQHVIITPGLLSKTNRNQKLVSSSSRRAMKRAARGSAISSGTRPLRLVVGDKTDSTGNKRKKRRLNKDDRDSNKRRKKQQTPSTQKRKQKPLLSYGATTSLTNICSNNSVFCRNSNNSNAPITNSAIKKRSQQWADQDEINKKRNRMKQRRRKSARSNKKTPPLKRCLTEPDLHNPFHSVPFSFLDKPLSRTQSMSVMDKMDKMDQDKDNNQDLEERGHSLPVQTFTEHSEQSQQSQQSMLSSSDDISASPLQLISRTRSESSAFTMKSRINFGSDDDERIEINNKINEAMDNNQEWMVNHSDCSVYINPFLLQNNQNIVNIPASTTNSIPPTPNLRKNTKLNNGNFAFSFGGYHHDKDDIFNSGDKRDKMGQIIPETPDLIVPSDGDGDGNGASNIKSHCKTNVRDCGYSDNDNDKFDNDNQGVTKRTINFANY